MKTRFLCLFFLLTTAVPASLSAQDLTGIWRGHFRPNESFEQLTPADDRYKIEVQIAQTNNLFHAVTYSYKNLEFYGKADASGTVNPKSRKVLLREFKILEVRSASGGACIMTCFLQYSKLGDEEFLQGSFNSVNSTDSSIGCGKGTVFLHKVTQSDFHKEAFLEKREKELLAEGKKKPFPTRSAPAPEAKVKKPSPASPRPSPPVAARTAKPKTPNKPQPLSVPQKKAVTAVPDQQNALRDTALKIGRHDMPVIIPRVLATRANEHIRSIVVNHAEVFLSIYDDGAIDNDTVSVYYDDKLIISKARISDQPVKLTIPVAASDQPHELVMVAENLGDIPPNTSLMVVRDGDKKYEVRVVSTEQKNAVISFQYKKIE